MLNGYIRFDPTEACVLPKIIKKEITPLDDDTIYLFLKAIKGHKYEDLFITALFTGMREGEFLGLQENCVDLLQGKLIVNKQFQKVRGSRGEYALYPTKNDKSRTIALSNFVLTALRRAHRRKMENKLLYGPAWEDSGFVFTDELGHHLKHQTVYLKFKKIVTEIGAPNARFHDLHHSFAVSSSVPVMILKRCRNIWAMLPRHSPWMFMAMSPTRCIKKVQYEWTASLRTF